MIFDSLKNKDNYKWDSFLYQALCFLDELPSEATARSQYGTYSRHLILQSCLAFDTAGIRVYV